VEDLILALSAYVNELEIIIVNDGSQDATAHIAEQLAEKHSNLIKIIHHKKCLGIGTSYRDALAIAKGDYFTWFPADHENSAAELISCLNHLKENAIVTCHHRGKDPRSLWRRGISSFYTWGLNRYLHVNLRYYNGLTIFPIEALRSFPLLANGVFLLAESIVRAIKMGYNVIELSAPLQKRNYGKSKALSFNSIKQILRDSFYLLFKNKWGKGILDED